MLLVLNLVFSSASHIAYAAPSAPHPTTGSSEQQPQIIARNPGLFAIAGGQYNSLVNMGAGLSYGLRLNGEGFIPPRWSGNWQDFGLFSAIAEQLDEPFNSLKASWQAEVPDGTSLELDLRVSPDGKNWTPWQILEQSGEVANFGEQNAFLFAQYRVRMFSLATGLTPVFKGVRLEANRRDLNDIRTASYFGYNFANAPASQQKAGPVIYNIEATREGLVGYRTGNGHIIQPRDHFVSLPSWTVLNDLGKTDYQVKLTRKNGRSAVAPVWDVGPWNFKDNYWHSPRAQFQDLPVGMPQAEAAYYKKHNGGLNESGRKIYNPSGIDIADGTYWDDLDLEGAWDERLDVTFIWESPPVRPTIEAVEAYGAWQNGFQVRWKTSVTANSWVEYGLTEKLGQKTEVDAAMVASHNIVLSDLVPGQSYFFKVFSKDIYGQESSLGPFKFYTTSGVTTKLNGFQNDKGIGLTLEKDNTSVLALGARVNSTLWNDNPSEDFIAGARTQPGEVTDNGDLDFDIAPVCDEKNENCSMGFGSGFKNFVRLANAKGDTFEVGVIHDLGLSPNGVTLMVEANRSGKAVVRRYNKPDSVDQKYPHHFHIAWGNGKVRFIFDNGQREIYDFDSAGLTISFIGAGRSKDDVVAANFKNIVFSSYALKATKPE